jgi:uncharacterized membrane protein YhiD involved in acid resistance
MQGHTVGFGFAQNLIVDVLLLKTVLDALTNVPLHPTVENIHRVLEQCKHTHKHRERERRERDQKHESRREKKERKNRDKERKKEMKRELLIERERKKKERIAFESLRENHKNTTQRQKSTTCSNKEEHLNERSIESVGARGHATRDKPPQDFAWISHDRS